MWRSDASSKMLANKRNVGGGADDVAPWTGCRCEFCNCPSVIEAVQWSTINVSCSSRDALISGCLRNERRSRYLNRSLGSFFNQNKTSTHCQHTVELFLHSKNICQNQISWCEDDIMDEPDITELKVLTYLCKRNPIRPSTRIEMLTTIVLTF